MQEKDSSLKDVIQERLRIMEWKDKLRAALANALSQAEELRCIANKVCWSEGGMFATIHCFQDHLLSHDSPSAC